MDERVWDKPGGPQPFHALTVRIRRRSIVLAISSILVAALSARTPAPLGTIGSSPSADEASTVTIGPALTLHIPPGLRVDPCGRCFVGPYLFRRSVSFPLSTGTENCGGYGLVGFGSTAASPSMVRARLNSTFRLTGSAGSRPSSRSLHTSAITIAGYPFTTLEYAYSGCRTRIAIGNVGGVTYLVDLVVGPADPAVAFILSSISFSN